MKSLRHIRDTINTLGIQREPFLMLTDFLGQRTQLWRLADIDPHVLRYNFHGKTNATNLPPSMHTPALRWDPTFISPSRYQQGFQRVQQGLQRGDSFLVNLTYPTEVNTNWNLRQVFDHTRARYRLWWKNHFTVFSPEIFVQMKEEHIYSFPMKGTLPAYLPAERLLQDPKEKAEHATIVDLIRNDLSQVARQVRVDDYRYVEQIPTASGGLWQTSTRIAGKLPDNFHHQLGDILCRLLPAGSVSGAPKPATLQIIREAEGQDRGFYTGVAILWDGYQLDSCVMIRFLEKTPDGHRYWSGGGITAYSNWQEEYQELKEKVYLPVEVAVSA